MNLDINSIRPGMTMDRTMDDHGRLANATPEERRQAGLAKLNAYIQRELGGAQNVVRSIIEETPRDRYVGVGAMTFDVDPSNARLAIDIMGNGTVERSAVAQHALDQTAERVGLNTRYLHDLQTRGAWGADLAATNLNTLLANKFEADERFLVREVKGQVRGVMSASYKRIDSRPTVDAIIGATQDAGALIVSGLYSETRVSLKVIKAQPVEVFPGEWMVFGLDYSNSDFGDGAAQFSAFLLRLACLNGCVSTVEFRKVHLGRRFSGDDGASERTLALDAATQASAARDQVKLLTSAAATTSLVEQVRKANSVAVSPDGIVGFLKTRTNKTEQEAIVGKFNSADVIELPAGQNAWRFSNAISWLAKGTEDGRRRMELERLSGEAMGA